MDSSLAVHRIYSLDVNTDLWKLYCFNVNVITKVFVVFFFSNGQNQINQTNQTLGNKCKEC